MTSYALCRHFISILPCYWLWRSRHYHWLSLYISCQIIWFVLCYNVTCFQQFLFYLHHFGWYKFSFCLGVFWEVLFALRFAWQFALCFYGAKYFTKYTLWTFTSRTGYQNGAPNCASIMWMSTPFSLNYVHRYRIVNINYTYWYFAF